MDPLVSVITINFNQPDLTMQLLESLRNNNYGNLEVIIVDNGSTQNPENAIKEKFPEAIVIASQKNLGFAGGNNLGIKAAKGKYLFFLNNDTELEANAIAPLVKLFETTADAGIASPKIMYYDSKETIQYAGSAAMNFYTGRNHSVGYKEKDSGQYNKLGTTALAHGAAMMVPRVVIEKVGLMPEVFFLYYEEIDWCESIKKLGYKVYFVPEAKVYHKESMSIGKNSLAKTYYMNRNRILFMRRHTSGLTKVSWVLFYLLFSVPKNTLTFLFRGQPAHLKAFWRALYWNVTHNIKGDLSFH